MWCSTVHTAKYDIKPTYLPCSHIRSQMKCIDVNNNACELIWLCNRDPYLYDNLFMLTTRFHLSRILRPMRAKLLLLWQEDTNGNQISWFQRCHEPPTDISRWGLAIERPGPLERPAWRQRPRCIAPKKADGTLFKYIFDVNSKLNIGFCEKATFLASSFQNE